ncbi:MAG TPA: hypothetical protein VHB73_07755 [Alphaproteobacteria bacterium]|nr:hypothetical protein [Alphaproteobacteria bacterium]
MRFFTLVGLTGLLVLTACADVSGSCTTINEIKAKATAAKNQAEQAYGLALQAQEEAEKASAKADALARPPKAK